MLLDVTKEACEAMKLALTNNDHYQVEQAVAECTLLLSELLQDGHIGMEWFSFNVNALLDATGWGKKEG